MRRYRYGAKFTPVCYKTNRYYFKVLNQEKFMQKLCRLFCRGVLALWLLALFALARPTQAQAVLNPNGGSVTGTLDAAHTALVYNYTPTKDGNATLTLTVGGNLSGYVQFYDSDGTSAGAYTYSNGVTPVTLAIPHLAPGATYYVHVVYSGGAGAFTLSSAVTPPAVANDAEPNNDYTHATTYAANSTITGHLGYSRTSYGDVDTQDWYKFTVPKDGDLTFTLTVDPTLYGYVQFYDSDGTSAGAYTYSSAVAPVTLTIPHLAPGTTYYVVVVAQSGSYGGYTLKNAEALPAVARQAAPDNTPATALPLPVNSSVTGHEGYSLGSYGAINRNVWYSFVAPQDGNAAFTLTTDATLPLAAYVEFYDSDGASQGSYVHADANSSNTLIIPHLAPGATYYVLVAQTGGYGGYTLSNAYAPQTVANDKENDDVYTRANAYAFGGTITGHLGYSRTAYGDLDSSDWYSLKVPSNGDATFTLTTDANLAAYVEFYDSDGASQVSYSHADANSAVTLTVPHLSPGATYYLLIDRTGGYGSYHLTSYLTPVGLGISPVPGTNPATAPLLAPNASVTGNLGYSQASYGSQTSNAWYSFVAPRDSDVTFTLAGDATLPLAAYVEFYDSDGASQITYSHTDANSVSSITVGHLAPGATYYIYIARTGGYGGYTLSNTVAPLFVANDAENNDTFDKAISLNNLTNITGHLGYSRTSYGDIDAADWYKIALPAGPFQANISVSGSLSGYFYLYAPDGATYLNYVGVGGGSATLTYNIPAAGTYYLLVQRTGGYGAYDINQPITATVYGTVTLDSIAQFAPAQTVAVEFRPQPSGTAFTRQISVGYNGAYFISNVPRGKYTLAFKGAKWLRKDITGIDVTVGDANGVSPFLAAGDANNDNSVDSTDFGVLIGAFNTESDIPNSGYDITADFNCDGFVDSTDFGLLIGNFNEMGDK